MTTGRTGILLRPLAATLALGSAFLASCGTKSGPGDQPDPVRYEYLERVSPRPLQIHVLRVDLRHPGIEVLSLIADDPDGNGPAHSIMADPLELSSQPGIIAAINANAFAVVPGSEEDYDEVYVLDRPARIIGWSKDLERTASRPQKGYFSFWVEDGDVEMYNLGKPKPADYALAGFGRLMQDGEITEQRNSPLHPRSAVGYDAAETTLTLVVVDGRQDGISEGMTRAELADLMAELGCATALNLDGGGSSILLQADDTGALQIKNRPSDGAPRPVPVMLGIRLTTTGQD